MFAQLKYVPVFFRPTKEVRCRLERVCILCFKSLNTVEHSICNYITNIDLIPNFEMRNRTRICTVQMDCMSRKRIDVYLLIEIIKVFLFPNCRPLLPFRIQNIFKSFFGLFRVRVSSSQFKMSLVDFCGNALETLAWV